VRERERENAQKTHAFACACLDGEVGAAGAGHEAAVGQRGEREDGRAGGERLRVRSAAFA
jgi:hypothetical protein